MPASPQSSQQQLWQSYCFCSVVIIRWAFVCMAVIASGILWWLMMGPAIVAADKPMVSNAKKNNQHNKTSIDYVLHVRPILQKHCYQCHGEKIQKSSLRLDIKSEAFKGGELYDASIIQGNVKESPLLMFLTDDEADLRMPPEGKRLSEKDVATLTKWIEQGAVWKEGVDLAKLVDRKDHWSFKKIAPIKIPITKKQDWCKNNIDRFILAKLEQAELQPAKETTRVTWLRRVSFDLIGLPPTPEDVTDFINDKQKNAYERVVEKLLSSPRYGERWGQHWLDVVRYADTHGFEVNTERPHAWAYRDYVIEAFNNNTPYNKFIKEQIVGDAMKQDAATGFLVTASVLLPGQIGKDAPSKRLARQDSLDEIVVNIGQTFLGLSIGCARCHDHKFDPISQQDYYAMQAFIAGVEYADRERQSPAANAKRQEAAKWKLRITEIDRQIAKFTPLAQVNKKKPPQKNRRPSINAQMNVDRFKPVKAKRIRFTIISTNNREPCLDELEVFDSSGTNIALATSGTKVTSSGDITFANRHELRFINDGQYGNSRSWMSNKKGKGWIELTFPKETTIERVIWGRDRLGKYQDRLAINYQIEVTTSFTDDWKLVADSRDRHKFSSTKKKQQFSTAGLPVREQQTAKRLLDEKKQLIAKLSQLQKSLLVFAGKFRKPDVIHVLRRGDPEQPQKQVTPATLSALNPLTLASTSTEQERRRVLAIWITSKENPLTARVMMNRIWQGHFGNGLVSTPNDFGRNGVTPSHPHLLDWLASEFVRSGWSIKQMHRKIVLSATYRQSTTQNIQAAQKDANVRLLWRYPTRRLDGETIRDTILKVNGKLNLKMGGAGFNLFDKRGGLTGFKPIESFTKEGLRRMIYAHKVRRERDAVFGAFDCPDAGQSSPQRRESTTPIQALNLFNSKFIIEQSNTFAVRVKREAGDNRRKQIQQAYSLALNRQPNNDELNDATTVVKQHGLATLCRVLFNCNEFLFIP